MVSRGLVPLGRLTQSRFSFLFFLGTKGETTHSWLSQLMEVNSPDGEYNISGTKG